MLSGNEQGCPTCGAVATRKDGYDRRGGQRFRCGGCRRRFTALSATSFSGYRFPPDIIALAVRWYLRYRLSYADVVELLAERGVAVDPSSVYAWVRGFAPRDAEAARACRRAVGERWSVDETYGKVAGEWIPVYCASDEHGQVVDGDVRARRAADAATTCFRRAIKVTGVVPTAVTTDCAAAYPAALATVLPAVEHEAGEQVQQRVERDHQQRKGRARDARLQDAVWGQGAVRRACLPAQLARPLLRAGAVGRYRDRLAGADDGAGVGRLVGQSPGAMTSPVARLLAVIAPGRPRVIRPSTTQQHP